MSIDFAAKAAELRWRRLVRAETKTEPNEHQAEELDSYAVATGRGLWWEPRCRKTKVVLDSAATLWQWAEIDALLVMAPPRVHENWIGEAERHLAVPWAGYAWSSDRLAGRVRGGRLFAEAVARREHAARAAVLDADSRRVLPVLCVPLPLLLHEETAKLLAKFVRRRKGRVLVAWDECHHVRKAGGKWGKRARALSWRCKYRRALTGTVYGNCPTGIWAQVELLGPGSAGFDGRAAYREFCEHHFEFYPQRDVRRRPKVKTVRHEDQLQALLARVGSIRTRASCTDLPSIDRLRLGFEPHPRSVEAVEALRRECSLLLDNGQRVTAKNAASLVLRGQQALAGWLTDTTGELAELFPSSECPRLALLLDRVTEALLEDPGRLSVIVWASFRGDVDRVAAYLATSLPKYRDPEKRSRHQATVRETRVYGHHGDMTHEARAVALRGFRERAGRSVLVATPGTLGEGLTLAEARVSICYSHAWDAVAKKQADARCIDARHGSVRVEEIHANGSSIDSRILDTLEERREFGDRMTGEEALAALRWRAAGLGDDDEGKD